MILFLFDMMFCVVMLESTGPCGDADPRHRLGPPAKEILSLPGSPARTVISDMLSKGCTFRPVWPGGPATAACPFGEAASVVWDQGARFQDRLFSPTLIAAYGYRAARSDAVRAPPRIGDHYGSL